MKPTIADTTVRFSVTGTQWDEIEREIELKLAALPHPAMNWSCDLSYRPLIEHGGYTLWSIDVVAEHGVVSS